MTSFKVQSTPDIPVFKRFSSQKSLRNPSSDLTSLSSKPTTKLNSASTLTIAPTIASKISSRRLFLRSYTNNISILMNNENIESPYTQLERIPSIELTANQPNFSKTARASTNKLKIMIPQSTPNLVNEPRTCTSIGGDRPRILLTSLTSGDISNSVMQGKSPLQSPNGQGCLYKGSSTTRRKEELATVRTNEVVQDKTWRITTQRSVGRIGLGVNVRENKINKILEEVQERMEGHQSLLQESSRVFNISLYAVKTEAGVVSQSPREVRETKVRIVEDGEKQVDVIARKLGDYRDMFKGQLEDLNKTKSHWKTKGKSLSERNLMLGRKCERNVTKRERIRMDFVRTMKVVLRKLAIMNLSVDEIVSNRVFSAEPYEREGSKVFIDNVKNGDYPEVKRMLNKMPYFVYDFDSLKQTALHWAAKRGFTLTVKLLLDSGADFNARDLSGRTPLFLAAKGGHINCVKLLLFYGADPTIKSGAEKLASEYTNDADIRAVIKKAYKIHVRLSICSYKKFRQNWALLDKRDFEVRKDQLIA